MNITKEEATKLATDAYREALIHTRDTFFDYMNKCIEDFDKIAKEIKE